MERIINELDHLCSVKEYEVFCGTQVLRDESSTFMYKISPEVISPSELIVKLPFLKHFDVNPEVVFHELVEEIKRNYQAPSMFGMGFDDAMERVFAIAKERECFIEPFYLTMPHNPNEEFFDDSGNLCTLVFKEDDMLSFNISLLDTDIYSALPYNLLFCVLFASVIAFITNRRLEACNIDFFRSYVRKEHLPKIGEILDAENSLDSCHIMFRKESLSFSSLEWKDLEIEIFGALSIKKAAMFFIAAFYYSVN